MNPKWTAIIIAAILPVLALVDVMLYWIGGNAATISAVMLTIRVKYPIVAHSVAYAFGLFLGHVFFPCADTHEPKTIEVLAKLVTGIAPIISAMLIIAAGDGQSAVGQQHITDPVNQAKFACLHVMALIVGGLVGRFWLSQHPLAGVLK